MSPKYVVLLPAALAAVSLPASAVPIGITESSPSYSQNFDTLAPSGTGSVLPEGWAISESGNSANDLYRAGTGSGTTGDTYSFGAVGSIERSLGGLRDGNLTPLFGAAFENIGSAEIQSLAVSYTGEQWRIGRNGRSEPDRLLLAISTDAGSLTDGTWSGIAELEFTAPKTSRDPGRDSNDLDGNVAANRTTLTWTMAGLSIAPGATFWLRWSDYDVSYTDDGLAIDDFSLTATFAPQGTPVPDGIPAGFAAAALLLALFLPRALERRPRS